MRVEISKNLPWQSVVVPKFFDAYRCGGDCKFPLEKKVNARSTSGQAAKNSLHRTGDSLVFCESWTRHYSKLSLCALASHFKGIEDRERLKDT